MPGWCCCVVCDRLSVCCVLGCSRCLSCFRCVWCVCWLCCNCVLVLRLWSCVLCVLCGALVVVVLEWHCVGWVFGLGRDVCSGVVLLFLRCGPVWSVCVLLDWVSFLLFSVFILA